ncbi:hypothetical protein P168DRAFT_326620 [Aspergillus campestris IBT 28561]|uniref:Uncharacterized protein n=1 Tax=Aspergillus campestris (strain IBT 28561) TaxID=1392248 RepID=A0A2I1D4Q1_ASPC2|nr:uncharacterized protein P168DRAFT_326620 [Aspergillus campestris IBT 28561]PKY04845.1 hypothetical protein P168DRAFT_326620 [Aspergillus campestris IBT 28561]
MSLNMMKIALDNGVLALSKRDREFTTFLNLKNEYHSGFITRLRQHVTYAGSSWSAIFEDEDECVKCAESFAEKFGVEYWGSEANREKYLLKDPLQSPDGLCVYPERKDELVRVLVLLLKLKAKLWVNRIQKSGDDTPTTTATQRLSGDTSSLSLEQTPGTGNRRIDVTEPRRPRKRESYKRALSPSDEEKKDPFHPKSPALSSSTEESERPTKTRRIRRFSDILASEQADEKPNNNNASDNETICENPSTSASTSPPPSPSPSTKPEPTSSPTRPTAPARANMRNPLHPSALQTRFGDQTFFLVRTSAQQTMAPVWVRFQRFPTTAAFIERLVNETKIRAWQTWDADAQLLAENNNNNNDVDDDEDDDDEDNGASLAPLPRVLAASVSFSWSRLEMRLRPDRNNDFQCLLGEIMEAWKAKVESEVPGRFFVRVTLHVEPDEE